MALDLIDKQHYRNTVENECGGSVTFWLCGRYFCNVYYTTRDDTAELDCKVIVNGQQLSYWTGYDHEWWKDCCDEENNWVASKATLAFIEEKVVPILVMMVDGR